MLLPEGVSQPLKLAQPDLSGNSFGNKGWFVTLGFRKYLRKFAYASQKVAVALDRNKLSVGAHWPFFGLFKIRGRGDFGISSKFDQNKGPWAKICPLFTPSGAAAQARRRQQRASCCGSVGLRLQKHRTHTLPERHRQAGNARPLPVTAHSHPALIGLLPRLCPGSLPHRSMSSSATRSKGKDIKKPMEWGDTKQDKWQQCAGISRRPARAGPARSLWRCPSQRSRPKRPQRSGRPRQQSWKRNIS